MKDKLKKNPRGHVHGKQLMIIGAVCVLVLVLSSWYSVVYNDSRLVVPMDFSSYSFQIKDLPMILSIIVFAVYIFYLFISLFLTAVKRNQAANESNITRRLNPRLGYLGFLGLLGFCGFWTYHVDQRVFPFAFSCSSVSLAFTMKAKCRARSWMSVSGKMRSARSLQP